MRALLGAVCVVAGCAVWADDGLVVVGHRTFFEKHCLDCHTGDATSSGVRLDTLDAAIDSVAAAERWQRVVGVLNSGEMPPPDEPQPAADEKMELLASASRALQRARRVLGDQGQAAGMRRLNRREHEASLVALFGLPADVDGLPADTGNAAFDTIGTALYMSSDHFEHALAIGTRSAAKAIAAWRRALAGPVEPAVVRTEAETHFRASVSGLLNNHLFTGYKKVKAWDAAGGKRPPSDFGLRDEADAAWRRLQYETHGPYLAQLLCLPGSDKGAFLATHFNNFPHTVVARLPDNAPPGRYVLRVRLAATAAAPPLRRFVEIGTNPGDTNDNSAANYRLGSVHQVTGTMDKPQVLEIPVTAYDGEERRWLCREKTAIAGEFFHFHLARAENGVGPDPAIWIDWVETEGPLPEPALDASLRELFGTSADDVAVPGIVERIVARAVRGADVPTRLVERVAALFAERRAEGVEFDAALAEAIGVVLASPEFLYVSGGADTLDGELTAQELAVRLALFVTAAPPDAELVAAARAGRLDTPAGREAEVRRLVAAPGALAFARHFTHQWLGLDRLDFFRFEPQLHRYFDEGTRQAAKAEVYHTFHHLVAQNHPPRLLLTSDFVVVNGLLAAYYGLGGESDPVVGDKFRAVSLPPDSPRGGLLGMAAILGMGSNGERTSPVERGAWVLRKLLADPPPDAPANVPQLSRLESAAVNTRERLRMHQEQPQCAQCHRLIDPIGLGLENFDAGGLWRTSEEVYKTAPLHPGGPVGKIATHAFPIEPAGALYGGPAFRDFLELRARIAEHDEAFLRGLVENLLAYGIGRPVSFSDGEAVAGLVEAARRQDRGLADLIVALVETPAFRKR